MCWGLLMRANSSKQRCSALYMIYSSFLRLQDWWLKLSRSYQWKSFCLLWSLPRKTSSFSVTCQVEGRQARQNLLLVDELFLLHAIYCRIYVVLPYSFLNKFWLFMNRKVFSPNGKIERPVHFLEILNIYTYARLWIVIHRHHRIFVYSCSQTVPTCALSFTRMNKFQ